MPAKRCRKTSVSPRKMQKLANEVIGVMDGIRESQHLIPECRHMLCAGCPESLGVVRYQRHRHQHLVVKLIGHVLQETNRMLKATFDAEQSKVSCLDGKKLMLDTALLDAKTSLDSSTREYNDAQKALQIAEEGRIVAEKTLHEKKLVQAEGDKIFHAATCDKIRFEDAIKQHLVPVQNGMTDVAHGTALAALAIELHLDESLIVGLPQICPKSLDERSGFERLMLEELQRGLHEQIAESNAVIDEEQLGVCFRAKSVQVAQRAFEDTGLVCSQKDAECVAAKSRQAQQELACDERMRPVQAFEQEYCQVVAARDVAKRKLDAFSYPLECYVFLRDRDTQTSEHPV